MLARTDSRARAVVLLLLTTVVAGAIGARLVWWQVVEREWLAARALEQLAQQHEIPAERGAIRDANGELLATTVELQSVFATPPTVEDPSGSAALLAGTLGIPVEEVRAKLASGLPYVWLKRRIPPEVADRVRSLDIAGVGMLAETQRVYPMAGAGEGTTIAAQILGYVNVDGVGQYGVEEAENALLAGMPGSIVAQEDVVGRRIADSIYQLREPVDGADLTLTIDAGVQHLLEAEMLETFKDNNAVGVTGIIMDVNTGAIVAMASFPSFDANAYASTDPALFTNPAVTRLYEPGSVMKAFTVAAALDARAITTRDTFLDDNNLVVRGARIQNADRFDWPYGHGPLTAAEVLKLSNNVGAARVGLELGGRGLYEAFRHYGFGSPTGIEIAGEQSGIVWNPDDPAASGELTTAQNAFGQGLTLTAVQLVAGYAAIANGGTLVRPHVIAGWTDVDGTFHAADQPPGEQIMREETADTVLRMLVGAIDDGIAVGASIPGYSVAGKTGTAQIAGPVEVEVPDGVDELGEPKTKVVTETRYIDGWVDSSFVGIVPAAEPRFVTLVLLHRPGVWGRYQMAERPESVYAELMPQVLDYLAIPPDRPIPAVARP